MEWFLPNTFSRKNPGVTMRGQLASTRVCKMLPGSEKFCEDTTSDQPNILVSYFCRPAVARRVLSAECSDSPVTTSTRPVTAAESSPGPASSGGQEPAGASRGRAPPWEHSPQFLPVAGGGDSCTATVSPECRW